MLDDVQQSLWRAAAELQRVRSTIPPTSTAQPPANRADVKGKGRAMFDVAEEETKASDDVGESNAPAVESPVAVEHLDDPIL